MEIREFHWLMNIVQNLDVGLVVLDRGTGSRCGTASWRAQRTAGRRGARSGTVRALPRHGQGLGSNARPTWCSSSTTGPSAPGSTRPICCASPTTAPSRARPLHVPEPDPGPLADFTGGHPPCRDDLRRHRRGHAGSQANARADPRNGHNKGRHQAPLLRGGDCAQSLTNSVNASITRR